MAAVFSFAQCHSFEYADSHCHFGRAGFGGDCVVWHIDRTLRRLIPMERKAAVVGTAERCRQLALAGNTYGISQVAYINDLLRKGWTEHGLSPSPPASDSEWCRRSVSGHPGANSVDSGVGRVFRDRTGQRKLNLVNRLLGEGPVKTDEDRRLNEHYTTSTRGTGRRSGRTS